MCDRLNRFRNDVAAAEAEDTAARAIMLSELKAMTLTQFANIPQATLESLTYNEYRDVLRSLVFDFETIDESIGEFDVEPFKPRRLNWLWSLLPAQMRAVLKGLGLGVLGAWLLMAAAIEIDSRVNPPVYRKRCSQATFLSAAGA